MDDNRKPSHAPEERRRDVLNHIHTLITMANVAHDHQHMLTGTTGPAMRKRDTHVHRIWIRTSFDPKNGETHWHEVNVLTGPALETPDGEHTHFYNGETSRDLGHCHTFSSVVDTSPDNECGEEDHQHYRY